jgi:hypothetical protein
MIDFQSLDRETRTVALVGRFLQLWSRLEMAIGAAIGGALGSSNLQQVILNKNITFSNKLHTLGALCYVSKLPYEEKENCRLLLNGISDFYPKRNHVAHDMFSESKQNDGVEFIAIRARGKLTMPDVDWSTAEFENNFARIAVFISEIRALSSKLRRSVSSNALAEFAAILPYAPTEGYTGLGSLGFLSPQHPAPPQTDTSSATPKTDPEIPPSPEK